MAGLAEEWAQACLCCPFEAVLGVIERRQAFYERHGRRPRVTRTLFYDDDGRLVDRFGRRLEDVQNGAAAAAEHARLLSTLADGIDQAERAGVLVFDRIAGDTFFERLRYNAYLLGQIAARDNDIADVLKAAADEDAVAGEWGDPVSGRQAPPAGAGGS